MHDTIIGRYHDPGPFIMMTFLCCIQAGKWKIKANVSLDQASFLASRMEV